MVNGNDASATARDATRWPTSHPLAYKMGRGVLRDNPTTSSRPSPHNVSTPPRKSSSYAPFGSNFMCETLIKIAVVTGSSRSIGAAVAKRLARDGASVVINYASNEAAAKEVADEINGIRSGSAVIVKADVSTVGSCKHLLDETLKAFGRIDILVLNAGIMGTMGLRAVDEKFFDDSFMINVKGPFFLVQAVEPHLTEGG